MKDIPVPLLAVVSAMAVDSLEYRSLSPRMVPVKFESFSDTCALSEWLWANVNRERKCDLCRKHFEYNERFQMQFSVALDAENNIKLLCRSCAATVNPRTWEVLIDGYGYSDTVHYLMVPWRGLAERALIGDTAEQGRATILQMLQAQKRTQDMAELQVLQAELERRRQARAAAVIQ